MHYVYAPVFSEATGWVVGATVNHVTSPLDREQVQHVCAILNALPVTRVPGEPSAWEQNRERVLDVLRRCAEDLQESSRIEGEDLDAVRVLRVLADAREVLARFRDASAGGRSDG